MTRIFTSDGENVFDLEVLKDYLNISISKENVDYDSDTSSNDSEIIPRKRRRMRIIGGEDSLEDLDEWRDVTEELHVPERIHFSVSPKVIGPQVPLNIVQLIQYFQLFFTEKLVNEIVKRKKYLVILFGKCGAMLQWMNLGLS